MVLHVVYWCCCVLVCVLCVSTCVSGVSCVCSAVITELKTPKRAQPPPLRLARASNRQRPLSHQDCLVLRTARIGKAPPTLLSSTICYVFIQQFILLVRLLSRTKLITLGAFPTVCIPTKEPLLCLRYLPSTGTAPRFAQVTGALIATEVSFLLVMFRIACRCS